MIKATNPKVVGLSRDGRTNRWQVTCPMCGFVFEPRTTMLSTHAFDCQKKSCGAALFADYNAEPPTVIALTPNTEISERP